MDVFASFLNCTRTCCPTLAIDIEPHPFAEFIIDPPNEHHGSYSVGILS